MVIAQDSKLTVNNRPRSSFLSRKSEAFEHVKTRHCNAFASFVFALRPRLDIPPVISRSSIQQHRNEENVDQTASNLQFIAPTLFPFLQKFGDAGHVADFKVLPSAVRGNGVELVWSKVALWNPPSVFRKSGDVEIL